jgi:hypothetical protein
MEYFTISTRLWKARVLTLILVCLPVFVYAQQHCPRYDRNEYDSWIDADGDCQNTRNEVLIEESRTPVEFLTERECRVVSGTWLDSFSGKLFTDPSLLDIDHVVPLKEAHRPGPAVAKGKETAFRQLPGVSRSLDRSLPNRKPE